MRGRKPIIPPLGDVVDLPSASVRIPECPAYLKGRARECWDLVVREMVAKNIYDTDTRDTVAAYCVQMARFLDCEDVIAEEGMVLDTVNGNTEKVNIRLGISNNAYDRMMKFAAELGLTPVSRKRVVKVRGQGSKAAASKFLKQA